jgi:hypothetical protein
MDFKEKILGELRQVRRKLMGDFINWLEDESDFFTAPCSVGHHLNVEGGLAEHSWNVFLLFKEKNERYKLGLSEDSVRICSLLHDVCKIHFYAKTPIYNRRGAVGDAPAGYEWGYEDTFPIGHGEKSVIRLLRYIPLTDEECCIIRWHMSAFNLDLGNSYQSKAYYGATSMYPACVALHTADYEATTFLEREEKKC